MANYPKRVYNSISRYFTFVEEYKEGTGIYVSDDDGETKIYLTDFNKNICYELFDGEITSNIFIAVETSEENATNERRSFMDFRKFETTNIYKVDITYVTRDDLSISTSFYIEADSKEEVEHLIVSELPDNWKQVLSHSVSRISLYRLTKRAKEEKNMITIVCVKERDTANASDAVRSRWGVVGEYYMVDKNTIYLDSEGDIYGCVYDLYLNHLGNMKLTRFQTVSDPVIDNPMDRRKLIPVYCHSGSSADYFGTYGNNYLLDINSLAIDDGEAYANLYRNAQCTGKMSRVCCRRFHSVV